MLRRGVLTVLHLVTEMPWVGWGVGGGVLRTGAGWEHCSTPALQENAGEG